MPGLISLSEAKRLGLKRYYTGRPCPHGHVAERSVVLHRCLECHRLYASRLRARHRKKARVRELRAPAAEEKGAS